MRKKLRKRTPQEKERIIHDIRRLGVVADCRKYQIDTTTYYNWLDRYEAGGIEAPRDGRSIRSDADLKKRDREIRLLKEVIAEKELTIKFQQEILEKSTKRGSKKGSDQVFRGSGPQVGHFSAHHPAFTQCILLSIQR